MNFYALPIAKRFTIVAVCLLCTNVLHAQLTAPERDWSGITEYTRSSQQDSIFIFFETTGTLKATHSSGNPSTFTWYKYNPTVSNIADRFEQINTQSGTSSELTGLTEGGYRVIITDNTDSTETYTAWLFTDDITISGVSVYNQCDFLELTIQSEPNFYDIENDRFVYYDLSRSMQTENNKYGRAYFENTLWEASDSRIEIPESGTTVLTIENTAPLYDASYSATVTNPFGRILTTQTSTIEAKATDAILTVQVNEDGTWSDYSDSGYEALLELRLESGALNADSVYWYVDNQKYVDYEEVYQTIWRDSAILTNRTESLPDKNLMTPGYYRIRHYSVNTTSGCIDSVYIDVTVDSSAIKENAIPNVFSPDNDGINSTFKFVDSDENIKSIRSFNIKIFSRSGKQVYSYSGDPKEWEGWNGQINGKGPNAAEGVYYYIIEARGWDDRTFKRGPYKGFLYLFRKK
ncbi:MAG TPA: gliding motility-associated C-terminal domain-containing protein [Tenuifilaceae bacterium]|nr:gliding motility-associated C-terminal domain-containing protein [Tenuifilaceae bacterium]